MTVHDRVLLFVKDVLAPDAAAGIDPDSDLVAGGVMDSVAMLETVVWLEDQFAIAVDSDDLVPENFSTIRSIVRYIETSIR